MYETMVKLHLSAGTVSLVLFWTQLMMAKGGSRHRLMGRLYFTAMGVVGLTSIPMTVVLAIRQHWSVAAALGFLMWITLSASVGTLMSVRLRDRRIPLQRRVFRVMDIGLLGIGIGLLALGAVGGVLYLGFGLFGVVMAIDGLRTPLDAPLWRSWRVRHLQSVLGTGIAVHVAFLLFGLRSLMGNSYTGVHFLIAFIVPSVLGIAGASFLTGRVLATEAGPAAGESGPSR